MATNIAELTSLQKQCLIKIIDLLFGKNYISANFGAISDSFYTIEHKDEYGNPPPAFTVKPPYGFTETRTTNFPMPLLNRTVNTLVEHGFLERIYRNNDNAFQLTDEFVEEAHRIFLEGSSALKDDIPAADRFVSVSDNQIDTSQAINALNELSEVIRASNDLMAKPEDKIQISKELSFLKDLISQPRIHVAPVWDAVMSKSTLKWLAKDAVSGVIRAAASKAFDALANLLTQIWPHN